MHKDSARQPRPYELLNWVADAQLKPGPKSVLLALVRFVGKKNGNRVWPGQEIIAKKTSLSVSRVSHYIKELDLLGYISVHKRSRKDGYRQPNEYFLNFGFRHATDQSPPAHTQSATPEYASGVSVYANEGDIKKELDTEKNVDSKDCCTPPSAMCASTPGQKNKIPGEKENKQKIKESHHESESNLASGLYQWTSNDQRAAESLVWHDLCFDDVGGRQIAHVLPHGRQMALAPDTLRLIDASRLASNYAIGCTKSANARVRFWHECGRLFFPTSVKFATSHKLSNPESKSLNRLFDGLSCPACYVIAYLMATWPTDCRHKSPSLSYMEQFDSDFFYREWFTALDKTILPKTRSAIVLAYQRYVPYKKTEYENIIQSLKKEDVESNVISAALNNFDPNKNGILTKPIKLPPSMSNTS